MKHKHGRPLKVSIHGKDLHVEAKFTSARLGEVLAEMFKRLNGTATMPSGPQSPEPQPSQSSPPSSPQSSIVDLIAEFSKSLRTEQVEVLMNTLDMAQKLLVTEIMTKAQVEQSERAGN